MHTDEEALKWLVHLNLLGQANNISTLLKITSRDKQWVNAKMEWILESGDDFVSYLQKQYQQVKNRNQKLKKFLQHILRKVDQYLLPEEIEKKIRIAMKKFKGFTYGFEKQTKLQIFKNELENIKLTFALALQNNKSHNYKQLQRLVQTKTNKQIKWKLLSMGLSDISQTRNNLERFIIYSLRYHFGYKDQQIYNQFKNIVKYNKTIRQNAKQKYLLDGQTSIRYYLEKYSDKKIKKQQDIPLSNSQSQQNRYSQNPEPICNFSPEIKSDYWNQNIGFNDQSIWDVLSGKQFEHSENDFLKGYL